jgi:hypothetical protein
MWLKSVTSHNRVACCVQTRTELGWNGNGEVIYKALEPLLYQREAAMIQPHLLPLHCAWQGGGRPHQG